MVEICYYNTKGNLTAKEEVKIPDNWGVRGKDATGMSVIDEEKPLYAQRKDICELLKLQRLMK